MSDLELELIVFFNIMFLFFFYIDWRFYKLVWGLYGMEFFSLLSGFLIGGSDNGVISIYDVKKIFFGDFDDLMVF